MTDNTSVAPTRDVATIPQRIQLAITINPDADGEILISVADEFADLVFKNVDTGHVVVNALKPSIMAMASAAPVDMTDEKNRDRLRKLAYRVTRSKTFLDGLGKEIADNVKMLPKIVDNNRKVMRDELDRIAAQVRKPLTDWEDAERERKAQHQKAIAWLNGMSQFQWLAFTTEQIEDRLEQVRSFDVPPDAGEYLEQYEKSRAASVLAIQDALGARERYDENQRDLARARELEAERRKKEEELQAQIRAREAELEAGQRALAAQQAELVAQQEALARAAAERERNASKPDIPSELSSETAALVKRVIEEPAQKAREAVHEQAQEITRECAAKSEDTPAQANDRAFYRGIVHRRVLASLMSHNFSEEEGKRLIELIVRKQIANLDIIY